MSIEDRRTDDLVQRIKSLTKDLDELRAMVIGRLPGASAAGGSIVFPDESGHPLATFGRLSDGSTGIQIQSALFGWNLAKMTDAGWIAPHLMGTAYDPAATKTVTSGTFADTYAILFGSCLGPGVEVMIPWVTAAATTAELQVTSNAGGTTAIHALPANSSGYAFVRWLHGTPPGTGPFDLRAQARRATGVGNVSIAPCNAWVQDPTICSSGGTWV